MFSDFGYCIGGVFVGLFCLYVVEDVGIGDEIVVGFGIKL